jgi:hypothetical protein
VPVNDPSVPGITAAFRGGAIGQANTFESTVGSAQASRQNGSFELWFKPDSLTGGDQLLYEIGGGNTGIYLSLQNDQLSFYVNGVFDGNNQTLSTTLTDTDWKQVVAVVHNTFEATLPSADDFIDLYVDGVLVGTTSASPTDINDWSGGNQAGLGLVAGVVTTDGPLGDTTLATQGAFAFDGQIAIFEYAPTAWTSTDVATRYAAVAATSAVAVPEPHSLALVGLWAAGAVAIGRRK